MNTTDARSTFVDESYPSQSMDLRGKGWSVKKDIIDKDVYNDNNDNIGTIEDLLVTRDKAISYAIIGVGGFLGMGQHDVAIPVHQLQVTSDKISLPGTTKDMLKAMPDFEYYKLSMGSV